MVTDTDLFLLGIIVSVNSTTLYCQVSKICFQNLQSMENDENDGNFSSKERKTNKSVINLNGISNEKLVKLLFCLDSGDKSTVKSEHFLKQNMRRILEAMSAFMSFMKDESISEVRKVLEARIKELYEYPLFEIPEGAANTTVRTKEQEILTFIEACKTFGLDWTKLEKKKLQAQKYFFLNEAECKGNFLSYSENLRIIHICDILSEKLVYLLCEKAQLEIKSINLPETLADKEVVREVRQNWESLSVLQSKLDEVEGFKEALFFCIVRILEINDKHNHLYTDKFEELLQNIDTCKLNEGDTGIIKSITCMLSKYPNVCQPTGYCLVFCVTKNRKGAVCEIRKVKEVFEKALGYTVNVVQDPTEKDLKDCLKEMEKVKYHFYDSFVFWLMAHGEKDEVLLGCGKYSRKEDIIKSFCKLPTLQRKPKVFFMSSCQGNKRIRVTQKGSVKAVDDGANEGEVQFLDIADSACNITAVYYEMDRLVAHATLPDKYAFRIPEEGSVYVDIVCRLLEKHRGENITTVLEKANNKVHQIIFTHEDKEKFKGEAKQACYYESTLQNTFVVPSTIKN
ncbi:uncharacterized protein LOC135219136 isoform X2 [Macrobrachium nipponense]|uniref:uncharacterized protein LOC135219136 isoform X2 n=1 Tax=Macrobrachium nipponense TaxID=159736 RepID=UPI0030C7A58A